MQVSISASMDMRMADPPGCAALGGEARDKDAGTSGAVKSWQDGRERLCNRRSPRPHSSKEVGPSRCWDADSSRVRAGTQGW